MKHKEERREPLSRIRATLPRQMEAIRTMREVLVAGSVMFAEIPSPTFREENRIRLLRDRFTEAGLERISVDEVGNGAAIVPGRVGNRRILVNANADSVFDETVEHATTLAPDRVSGPGICDNCLGLSVLSALPEILRRVDLELDADLVLVGSTRSLGHGNIEGIRFFLEHYPNPIHFGICLRSVHLGRLSYSSLGLLRGEISVAVPETSDWKRTGSSGAITVLNRLITRMQAIPLPQEPATTIVLGSVESGTTFHTQASNGILRFEVRSEEKGMIPKIHRRISYLIEELTAETQVNLKLKVVARRALNGIPFTHPMVRTVRSIFNWIGVSPVVAPSTGELAALLDARIPSVTLGLTRGEKLHQERETAKIDPVFKGVAQLLALLQAIDQGACDEED